MTRIPRMVLAGGVAVAILDGLEPVIFHGARGVPPGRIFQSIAAGLLGRDAFSGGTPTVLLGMALHLFIATVVVITYWLASRKLPALTKRPILFGMLYGLAVYAVMNYIVIPLSALGSGLEIPAITFNSVFWNGIFATLFCIGLPTGLFVRAAGRADSSRRQNRWRVA